MPSKIVKLQQKQQPTYSKSQLGIHYDDNFNSDNSLDKLLAIERLIFKNQTGILENQIPKYPITSNRDMHQNDDVYIARANDPFGHSTKWLQGLVYIHC